MASNINQIKRSALDYVKTIGKGAFSTVYHMIWQSPDGPVNVAAKRLNSKDENELEILSELDHQNIVKLIGVVDEEIDFMLILELCEGGSLRSYLEARNGKRLSTTHFFNMAKQAARPLKYLRENKCIHKDVKSPNYLVTSQNTLKLCDFGLAKYIDETICNATARASYNWMAPELLSKCILSPKFDIFALAVVLWELWTGRFPWEGVEPQVIVWKVCNENSRLPIPEDCPKPIKDLLRQCWKAEWELRPDINKVLQVITITAGKILRTAPISTANLHTVGTILQSPSPSRVSIEARHKQIIAGPWNMVQAFEHKNGKLGYVTHMTLSPGGDLVIADQYLSQIKIFSLEGELKSSIITPRKPCHVVVSSDNTCFIADTSRHIAMYKLGSKLINSWEASCPHDLGVPSVYSLAIDPTGNLLLCDLNNKHIYTHKQDGTHVNSIGVGILPWHMASTSQGTIVIADKTTAPQVISNTGEVLYTLYDSLHAYDVYCHDGMILVSNIIAGSANSRSKILCYNSESGKCLGPMPMINNNTTCRPAMTSDSKTLCVYEGHSVKVYTRGDIQI